VRFIQSTLAQTVPAAPTLEDNLISRTESLAAVRMKLKAVRVTFKYSGPVQRRDWLENPPTQPGGFSMMATNLTGEGLRRAGWGPGAFGVHFGASGLLGQYFDLVTIHRWASSSV
jgi:hypothetical protein